MISGVCGGLCLLPAVSFLGIFPWRFLVLAGVCLSAFGIRKKGLYAGGLYLLFQTVLRFLVPGSVLSVMAAVAGGIFLYILWLRRKKGTVQVELSRQGRTIRLNALQDTGNTLKDPVTGKPVLIVGPKAAETLTGLKKEQLQNPIKTMKDHPVGGLRLIPYKAVGSRGFLLGLKLPKVKIGSWQGSQVVAFAPAGLEGNVQALIGGTV
jgi:stage II sporulation protein GA (sporulation sigma-E factor processing peptidase)